MDYVWEWKLIEGRRAWRDAREGAYLLRTNLKEERTEELWKKHIQLTEAEAVFRALKSELAIRPIFHQKEHRVKAHILVAFLGYALWVTFKHLLKRKSSDLPPARALTLLSTLPQRRHHLADHRRPRNPSSTDHHFQSRTTTSLGSTRNHSAGTPQFRFRM